MNFSKAVKLMAEDKYVRVDFFKPSGKWYTTESIEMLDYDSASPNDSLMKALNAELYLPDQDRLRYSGMVAVCLEPYHKLAFPLMLTVPEYGPFEPHFK